MRWLAPNDSLDSNVIAADEALANHAGPTCASPGTVGWRLLGAGVNGLGVELIFPEGVHGAGLRLFDLVAQAALPEFSHTKPRRHEEEETMKNSSSKSLRGFVPSCETQIPANPREPSCDPSFLPRLRQTFETLHDTTHPLRIALDKLATLETVRLIEGQA